ncbi:hypothetical protein NOVO_09230 (plasmid) [Rickettsiales bacterium Ac37b]|nr:hypothetical protein NOVO_09230 [Rickettsiales bacterium Ac37b]
MNTRKLMMIGLLSTATACSMERFPSELKQMGMSKERKAFNEMVVKAVSAYPEFRFSDKDLIMYMHMAKKQSLEDPTKANIEWYMHLNELVSKLEVNQTNINHYRRFRKMYKTDELEEQYYRNKKLNKE